MIIIENMKYRVGELNCYGYVAYNAECKQPLPCVMIAHDWRGRGDAACEKALSHFETIRQSLIEDSPRLGVILITQKQIHTVPFKGVYELEFVGKLPEGLPSHAGRAIWLVDPLGNIILDYDPVALDNRLLLDLRHLLKVSRIG